jgi:hypothetical protein
VVGPWRVDFHEEEEDGSAPVEDFLESLTKEQRAKALAVIRKLEEEGPALPFPFSSQVRGPLRELRTRFGRTRLRILYSADASRTFVLLHGFVKTTEKIEQSDLRTAERRMTDHVKRLRGRD